MYVSILEESSNDGSQSASWGFEERERYLFELPLSVDIRSPRGRLEIELEDVCDSMRVS